MLIDFLYDTSYILSMLFIETVSFCLFWNYNLCIRNIIHNIASVNIFYTKLLQACASNDAFDSIVNKHLISITDNVPYTQKDIDKVVLRQIQEKYHIPIFLTDDPDEDIYPINSGSISLVFVDTMSKYAIKIKRRNIEKQVEKTTLYLKMLIFIIKYIPYLRKLRLPQLIQKNIEKITEQLDFQNEANNILSFRKIYENIEYIHIPQPFHYITSDFSNVIVCEYMNDCYRIENIPEEKKLIFSKLILKMTFLGGLKKYIHGDLHSGNILFTEKKGYPQLVLLDFGIIMKLSNHFSKNLSIFMYNHEEYTIEQLSSIMLTAFVDIPSYSTLNNISKEAFDKHISSLLNYTTIIPTMIKSKTQFSIVDILQCIQNIVVYIDDNNLSEYYEINVNQDYYYFSILLIMATSVVQKLCKDDLIPIVNTVFKEMYEFDLFS
jgi:predicted unusual protein kinase regulating ubiquinone biosynthesis (AarF/ABC1/UbiB family)